MHEALTAAFESTRTALSRAAAYIPERVSLSDTLADIDRLAASSSFAQGRAMVRTGATVVAAAAFAMGAPRAFAEPLNPADFVPINGSGGFTVTQVTFNTDTVRMEFASGGYIPGILHKNREAVFCFENLTLTSGYGLVNVVGKRPLVLLAYGSITVQAPLSVSGQAGSQISNGDVTLGGAPSPGGGGGGDSYRGGGGRGAGIGGGMGQSTMSNGPVGGSFGGGSIVSGIAYGDLFQQLEGGSGGGGAGVIQGQTFAGPGGAGGGAIELGALGWINITKPITADGGNASCGGAGSGGGILIHAPQVAFTEAGSLFARGGESSCPTQDGRPRAGNGGRIVVQGTTNLWNHVATASGGGSLATHGSLQIVEPDVVGYDIDFGFVPVGESRTLTLNVRNGTSQDSRVCGQFPLAGGPFRRLGQSTFSGLEPGRIAACRYAFTPTTEGLHIQTLDIPTDAGTVRVVLYGVGGNSCGSADFNGDGDTGTDQDIEAFFRVLGGGSC